MSGKLNAKALSWFDNLATVQKEFLLREAGRSWFTFDEIVDTYVNYLEYRNLQYEKIIKGWI